MQTIMSSNNEEGSTGVGSREFPELAQTLVKTFTGYESDLTPLFFLPMLRYFTRIQVSENTLLWRRGDRPDGLYVVESGVLRATYDWDNSEIITESMVSGTLAGELSGLANMPRNTTVVAENTSIVWKLDKAHWARFKEEQPGLAHRFIELVLKGSYLAKIDLPEC
jgi:sulfate permease, SulP family